MSTDQRELQLTNNVAILTFFSGNPVTPRGSVFAQEQKISSWIDSDENGRFMRNFDEDVLCGFLGDAGFEVKEVWKTEDGLGRNDVLWLNVIAVK